MFDIFTLMDNPTFMFVFHEVVCILGSVYYLVPMLTRLREKKEQKPFSSSWKNLKNIVATYVVVAESIFLYEDIKTSGIINPMVAIVSQVLAIIIIAAAYIVLKEEPEKSSFKAVANNRSKKIK